MKFAQLLCHSAAVSALAFTSVAVHADTLDDIRQAKKVRISIDLAIPPAGMADDKLQPIGSDVETARLLAKDLGVALEIVPTTGATRIPNLQTNKADLVISTLSVTPERAKVIDFSVPYAGLQSVVGAARNVNIKSLADLNGKTVTVSRSTTQDTDLTQNAKGANIVRYDDDATLVTAAVSGQAEIIATSLALVNTIKQKNPSRQMEVKFVLRNFGLGVGMRKDEPRLLAWVNEWVKTNLKNGKLNEIYKKYYGVNLSDDILNGAK